MPRLHTAALLAVVAATALLAVACTGDDSPGADGAPAVSPPATSAAAPSGPTATSVALADSPLGALLVDGRGRTVYLFEQDASDASTCYDACATAWPPLLTSGVPVAGTDVRGPDLGTSTRRDGSMQVTYHGHPLYLYAGDRVPGDTSGQGLNAFGARWYVVGVDGTKIER